MASNSTKNSMPSFAQGKYENILKLIADEKVNAPTFIYFTDKECLGFLDAKKNLHVILWDKIEELNKKIDEIADGLVNPDTGETISVTTYVSETVVPVQEKVRTVTDDVEEIKKTGAAIMLTSKDINGGDE